MDYPKKVKIVEVGPRDGLQNDKRIIPTEDKVRFIDLLTEAGLSEIEAGSFVHPRWVPQLADTTEVYRRIKKREGVSYPVLVPNLKGLSRAIEAGVREIAVFTAASESFNKKNINMSVDESLEVIREILLSARREHLRVRGYVSTCFACPYEGRMQTAQVSSVIKKLFDLGVDEISLGDTIGSAVPTEVEVLLESVTEKEKIPKEKIAVHFHNTRGTALANILVSIQMGISIIDSSAGGLGGCPYAPGASGNVATEEVLYMLHGMGIETGVSLEKVVEASKTLRAFSEGMM